MRPTVAGPQVAVLDGFHCIPHTDVATLQQNLSYRATLKGWCLLCVAFSTREREREREMKMERRRNYFKNSLLTYRKTYFKNVPVCMVYWNLTTLTTL